MDQTINNNTLDKINYVDFGDIDLPIPLSVTLYSYQKQKEIHDYLLEMDNHHRKAYLIAYNHLGTSFYRTLIIHKLK
jgi:hypothetical protein